MTLTITVVSQNDETLGEALQARFDATGGTIGRGAGSTLLLPDPTRQISRTHALIELRDGAYTLTSQGSVTPVIVNTNTLANGQSARIRHGDEIVIGGYRMRVEGDTREDGDPSQDTTADETLNGTADISMIGTVLSWSEQGTEVPVNEIQTVIVSSPTHQPVDDKTMPATTAPTIPSEKPPTDLRPPPVAQAPAPVTAATPSATPDATVAVSPAQTPDALLQAFLDGAGVPRLSMTRGVSPELMQAIGEMLRETVRGLLDLLHARALTKREVRADATVIVAQDNNPLKFSPSVEAAMAHLLVPRGMGFMPPLRAVADAHQSLRSHQLAFMAGMQAGLASVLKRLDPHALSQRSGQPSLMGAFVPTTHKARLWEQYAELHASIARDADADFQSLFGREFLKAYQTQVTRLREQQSLPSDH